jgi:hypothetical protein
LNSFTCVTGCLNGLAGLTIPPEVWIFNGLPTFVGANRAFTGDETFSAVAEGVFLGDGEGGKTAGSLARNVFAGVVVLVLLGLGFGFFFSVIGLELGDISSGKFSKFNRRRTSYPKCQHKALHTSQNPKNL